MNSLVSRAVDANFDLQIAVARLQEARAAEFAATGGILPGLGGPPAIDFAAAAARGTGNNVTRARAPGPITGSTITPDRRQVTHLAGFDASWEIDLFGRYGHLLEASQADTQAALEARNDVLITVVADVVRAYVEVRTSQYRLDVARQNAAAQQRTLDLVRVRFQQGLANELDVALAERLLSTTQSRLAPLEAAVASAERRVAVLVGQYPEQLRVELERPGVLPATPPQVAPDMPVELLRRRPDLRRAERAAAASTARTGVATADLFPRVALIAALGRQGQGLGVEPVKTDTIWSFGPALYWPFLDFGRLEAAVQVQDFRTRQLLLNYKRAVVAAVQEVDDAISNYAAEQDRLARLDSAVAASRRAATLAEQRYNIGLVDFLNVLDAQRQLYELQDQFATAQDSLIRQFIAVYKALGGGWEGYETPPPPAPRPALIAAGDRLLHPNKPEPGGDPR